MDFREADRRYAELKREFDADIVSVEDFNAQRQRLMVQDEEGRWWARTPNDGEWSYYDGSAWVRSTPPGYQEVIPGPTTYNSPAQTTLLSPRPNGAEKGETGHQRLPFWVLLAGLGGTTLVGIVLVVWMLVPYLQDEPVPSKQGESPPDGATLDAVFVHQATPENISANSTYLDNPLTNDDPDVILYATQNWNPGGGAGTYNEHPIGVWYDSDARRWAIFNQDREAMPEGVAFNVAVLEEPTGARQKSVGAKQMG